MDDTYLIRKDNIQFYVTDKTAADIWASQGYEVIKLVGQTQDGQIVSLGSEPITEQPIAVGGSGSQLSEDSVPVSEPLTIAD